ncbi:MAG: hypothetical protein OXF41_08400 [bacterium]|nr:hypothetical protein [bacterium]
MRAGTPPAAAVVPVAGPGSTVGCVRWRVVVVAAGESVVVDAVSVSLGRPIVDVLGAADREGALVSVPAWDVEEGIGSSAVSTGGAVPDVGGAVGAGVEQEARTISARAEAPAALPRDRRPLLRRFLFNPALMGSLGTPADHADPYHGQDQRVRVGPLASGMRSIR